MSDNQKRSHDFALLLVQNRIAKDEKCELLDLMAEYNIAYSAMLKELSNQDTE